MPPVNIDKEIILSLDRYPPKTVLEMRLTIADRWRKNGRWPLYADFAGSILGEQVTLWLGNVPTPIYFRNALERLERLGIVVADIRSGATWRLSSFGLSSKSKYELEEANTAPPTKTP